MVKLSILFTAVLLFIASANTWAQPSKESLPENQKSAYKFLNDISIEAAPVAPESIARPVAVPAVKKDLIALAKNADGSVESAAGLQFKYALLMDVEVELVKNLHLLRLMDNWYGVRYIFGGSTKNGIDCSALMQVFFTALYGITLPRTAKMQYDFTARLSRTELKEGDLVFFNTRGGVSHVGMYLMNNKFVHSSARGVTISDLYDPYYSSRFIGAGRVANSNESGTLSVLPRP